jgi:hypothetical protein
MVWRNGLVGGMVLALLCACGGGPSTAQSSPSASPAASPSALTCSTGGPASSNWPSAPSRTSTAPPIVSAQVTGETLILTFDQGTPEFEVRANPSSTFTAMDGRGGVVNSKGSVGVLIVLRGFRGDMQNYTGAKIFMASGPLLQEVQEIGDYEGVVGWAAGLATPGCAAVTTGGSTLTFRFIPSS